MLEILSLSFCVNILPKLVYFLIVESNIDLYLCIQSGIYDNDNIGNIIFIINDILDLLYSL